MYKEFVYNNYKQTNNIESPFDLKNLNSLIKNNL